MYKVGDRVQMDKNKIINRIDEIPNWYTEDIYTIVEIINDDFDFQHYQIVKIKNLGNITSQWLKPSIRETRKMKLQKILNS
jgi:hypothetical protein